MNTFLILSFIAAFCFRYLRELEDEIARKNRPNKSLLKLRKGESLFDGSLAKWYLPFRPYTPRWYHFGIRCNHRERFPFSSTLFVFITDTEHFYQFLQTISIIAAVTVASFVSWYLSLTAFVSGLIVAQIVKEINKNIN